MQNALAAVQMALQQQQQALLAAFERSRPEHAATATGGTLLQVTECWMVSW